MMIGFAEVTAFKKEMEKEFRQNIHFHDRCGGQFFTIDEPSAELQEYITKYFENKGMKTLFTDDGDRFMLEG